jgi:non-specific serine/threonine protein kinase
VEAQATDRAFRIGQQKNVLVHKFVCRGRWKRDRRADRASSTWRAGAGGRRRALLTEMSDAELLRVVSLDLRTASTP